MAATIYTSPITVQYKYSLLPFLAPRPKSGPIVLHQSSVSMICSLTELRRRKPVCFALKDEKIGAAEEEDGIIEDVMDPAAARVAEKVARKKSERATYLVAAVMSSLGISSMAIFAVYYRFYWQMEGGEVPYAEMFCTFALAFGAAVGMEFWARWAHRALWHASLWNMHESHHKPREGPFELNDIFAIINAVPAIALLYYGSLYKGLVPGLCFGALTGEIPMGNQLQTLVDASIYEGNPGLCGAPLPKKCHEDKASPNLDNPDVEGEEDKTDRIWLYGIVISGFATGFWGAIGVLVFKIRWRHVYF